MLLGEVLFQLLDLVVLSFQHGLGLLQLLAEHGRDLRHLLGVSIGDHTENISNISESSHGVGSDTSTSIDALLRSGSVLDRAGIPQLSQLVLGGVQLRLLVKQLWVVR